jgi:hypothetical protein
MVSVGPKREVDLLGLRGNSPLEGGLSTMGDWAEAAFLSKSCDFLRPRFLGAEVFSALV